MQAARGSCQELRELLAAGADIHATDEVSPQHSAQQGKLSTQEHAQVHVRRGASRGMSVHASCACLSCLLACRCLCTALPFNRKQTKYDRHAASHCSHATSPEPDITQAAPLGAF
jgi:hypothetical protein